MRRVRDLSHSIEQLEWLITADFPTRNDWVAGDGSDTRPEERARIRSYVAGLRVLRRADSKDGG